MLQWPVVVKETHVGRGVFAGRAIHPEEEIGRIEGELFDDPDHDSNYSIGIDDTYSIEPFAPFRFLNHSCEPNCELVVYDDAEHLSPDGIPEVYVIALKEITPGAELSIDYGWPATSAIPCQCNTPRCRGWIVDADELALISPTPSTPRTNSYTLPADKPSIPEPIPAANLLISETPFVVMPPMSVSIGPETKPTHQPFNNIPFHPPYDDPSLNTEHLKWVINAD